MNTMIKNFRRTTKKENKLYKRLSKDTKDRIKKNILYYDPKRDRFNLFYKISKF